MIICKVGRNGNEAEIRFPCDEKDICRVQAELEIPYETDTRVKLLGIDTDIEQLEVLEGQTLDLDFLNLLGRLMYGMDAHEYDQFRMGLYHESPSELKDIINISQVPNRYSIIDPENLYTSGLNHEFDLRGGIPKTEVEETEYEPIAQKLIDSGKCEDTPYGKLYVNDEIPVEEFFDGEHLPPYFDRDFQIACFLDNGTDRDFMMLPCTDTELLRSAKRLNTSFPYDLKVSIEDFKDHNSDLISRLFKGADIYTLNRYANLVARFSDEKKEKFTAVLDYVNRSFLDLGGLGSLSAAVKIGNALEAFTYYPNAMDDEELGMTLLEEHDVPEELWQYFDSESYGEDFRKEERGDFSDSGYVGINDHYKLRQCMTQNQGMGGIE